MTILTINQLEKRAQNTLMIPAFDLTIKRGETVAIQCNAEIQNTLIQIIIGTIPATSGELHFDAFTKKENRQDFFRHIGLCLQTDALYERLSLREYLRFFQKLYDVSVDIDALLEKIGLIDKKNLRSEKLSFSEKKRLHFARTILHAPEFIILEDPTQNIDIESTIILHRIISELEEKGMAILLTTSNLETAISITNHVYRLNDTGLKKVELVDENKNSSVEEEKEGSITNEVAINNTNLQIRFDKIPAKVEDKLILFDPTEIDFIESNSGVSHLNVKGDIFPCAFTLSELDTRLQHFGFFRCHRSYIVNLQKVREVITWTRNSYSLILDDPKKSSIPLSKGKLDELKNMIGI